MSAAELVDAASSAGEVVTASAPPSDLVIVGGGRMGSALVGGIISAGAAPAESIVVVDASERVRADFRARFPGIRIVASLPGAEQRADPPIDLSDIDSGVDGRRAPLGAAAGAAVVGRPCGAIVAVKPADAQGACRALADAKPERVLSIVAGVPSRVIERWIGDATPVVRAMPNTPALVRCGTTAIAAGADAGQEDLDWAESVMGALGVVVRVPEEMLDAVTGLSGSGPAYIFLVAEALASAGVAAGLQPETSRTLAFHTLNGAARMLLESTDSPEKLRDDVTSPGGTTAAGLAVLNARQVRAAFIDAVLAAQRRSAEMGREASRES